MRPQALYELAAVALVSTCTVHRQRMADVVPGLNGVTVRVPRQSERLERDADVSSTWGPLIELPEIERFWLPPGTPLPLIDRGFMPDPADPSTAPWIPEARTFGEIDHVGCLILVGEPGLGKSTALEREADRKAAAGAFVHPVDLSSTRDETVLRSMIFTGPAWDRWAHGEGQLHLFLDALDFALIRLDTVVEVLIKGLGAVDPRRVTIRLACRTAVRQSDLESWLRRRWGPDAFGVHELAPLRLPDVAASAQPLAAPAEFVETVIAQSLQPLAMTPMTRRMLLDLAMADGTLPRSRRELYKRGCVRLCEEVGPARRRTRQQTAAAPTTSERFATAQRLGGLQILGAASGVTADDQALAALAGGVELDDQLGVPADFEIREQTVRDVLDTGLFTTGEDGRIDFAHQTFGEFLCGRWLAKTFSARQLDDVLFAATDGGLRVIPQLREAAAWLAAHSPDFAARLVDCDPGVLLRADPYTTLADERRLMVDALVRGVGKFELDRFDVPVRAALEHLAHPGLETQLRATLADPDAPFGAREIATDIAVACNVTGLEGDLLELALDERAEIPAREAAAVALGRIGSDAVREQLTSLALDPPETDVDDELKGAALAAIWPDLIALEDLLPALTTPKRTSLYGSYKQFLNVRFVRGLREEGLAAALSTAAHWPGRRRNPLNGLADAREDLMTAALKRFDRDDVVRAYVEVVARGINQADEILPRDAGEDPLADSPARRRLASELARLACEQEFDGASLVYSRPPLIRREDMQWLLEQRTVAVGTADETFWASAAQTLLLANGAIDHRIFEAREISPLLRGLTRYAVEPIVVASAEAEKLRERHRKLESLQNESTTRRQPPFDVREKTAMAKALWDSGDPDGYWAVMGWTQEVQRGDRSSFFSDVRVWQAGNRSTSPSGSS